MASDPTRRRVLQLTGIGATASLAGCSRFDISGDDSDDEIDADTEPDIDLSEGITAIVQPSREELGEVEREITAEIEDGELEQADAQAEFRERQRELFVSRSIEFESELSEDDDVSVEAGIGEQGAFLLDAPDERLIDMLRNGEADALLPGEEYAAALDAQERSASGEGAEPVPEDDQPDDENGSGNETEGVDGSDGTETGTETPDEAEGEATDGEDGGGSSGA